MLLVTLYAVLHVFVALSHSENCEGGRQSRRVRSRCWFRPHPGAFEHSRESLPCHHLPLSGAQYVELGHDTHWMLGTTYVHVVVFILDSNRSSGSQGTDPIADVHRGVFHGHHKLCTWSVLCIPKVTWFFILVASSDSEDSKCGCLLGLVGAHDALGTRLQALERGCEQLPSKHLTVSTCTSASATGHAKLPILVHVPAMLGPAAHVPAPARTPASASHQRRSSVARHRARWHVATLQRAVWQRHVITSLQRKSDI
mmetsp:Transcript_23132/g.40793  ORF Transcript_23132/g.40793 Transcript_23132/m.40793 type:complete len:256 (-) Transcript_23132:132-899(-)